MATAADVLRSVNLILQSGQERERFEVQTALTMMQMSQAQKAQNIEIASKSLELATAANREMKYGVASSFLQNAGLGAVHAHFTTKYPTKALSEAVDEFKSKEGGGELGLGAGMSDVEANRVVSAIWSLQGEAKNADPMIDLATEIKGVNDYRYDKSLLKPADSSIRMHKALGTLGFFEDEVRARRQLGSVAKYLSNKRNILQETFELSQGDVDIQSDIGAYDPSDIEKSLAALQKVDPEALKAFEEEREGEGAGAYGTGGLMVATAYGLQAAGVGITSEYEKYQAAAKKYREVFERNLKSKAQGGLTPKGFEKKYGIGKKVAQTEKGLEQITKLAKGAGRGATATVQAAEAITNMKYIKGIADISKKLQVGTLATYATPLVASEVSAYLGEAAGGEFVGDVSRATGQTLGTVWLANKTGLIGKGAVAKTIPKVPFMKFLAQRFPAMAVKWAGLAAVDSPWVPLGDLVGLGLTIIEIYNAYQDWTNIHIPGEEIK